MLRWVISRYYSYPRGLLLFKLIKGLKSVLIIVKHTRIIIKVKSYFSLILNAQILDNFSKKDESTRNFLDFNTLMK
jgi:hypothetical protein